MFNGDVKIIDSEANWHRRKIKRPQTYAGEAGFKQRHLAGTPARLATACHMMDTTSKVSPLKKAVRDSLKKPRKKISAEVI